MWFQFPRPQLEIGEREEVVVRSCRQAGVAQPKRAPKDLEQYGLGGGGICLRPAQAHRGVLLDECRRVGAGTIEPQARHSIEPAGDVSGINRGRVVEPIRLDNVDAGSMADDGRSPDLRAAAFQPGRGEEIGGADGRVRRSHGRDQSKSEPAWGACARALRGRAGDFAFFADFSCRPCSTSSA